VIDLNIARARAMRRVANNHPAEYEAEMLKLGWVRVEPVAGVGKVGKPREWERVEMARTTSNGGE